MATFTTSYQFIAIDKFSKTVRKMNSSISKMSRGMSKMADKAASVQGAIGGVATGLLAKNIIMAGANFEKAMDNVASVTNAVGLDFKDLTIVAKQMGSTTVFTAKEAADSMYFLGLAGFS